MEIKSNPSLQERTTLRLGGRAIAEVRIQDEGDWNRLVYFLEKEGGTPLVIGQGSNLLPVDGKLPFILIRINHVEQMQIVAETWDKMIIQVGAGVRMAGLLRKLCRLGLTGLEPLIGIPGSVGGATVMNAGAYGRELGDLLQRIQAWSPQSGKKWLNKEDISFGYRSLDLNLRQDLWIITKIELELKKGSPNLIRKNMRKYYFQKKENQPILTKTCGCVFKNPDIGVSAGKILDQCGFRGYRLGKMAFSRKHANFLINLGGGTSSEALELINMARSEAKKDYGVDLDLEVKIIEGPKEKYISMS